MPARYWPAGMAAWSKICAASVWCRVAVHWQRTEIRCVVRMREHLKLLRSSGQVEPVFHHVVVLNDLPCLQGTILLRLLPVVDQQVDALVRSAPPTEARSCLTVASSGICETPVPSELTSCWAHPSLDTW